MEKVKLSDVAAADVSLTAVSRVINNSGYVVEKKNSGKECFINLQLQ